MKTILLSTDFSRAANKATTIAAEIAIKQQARLILYHSYRFMNTYDDNYGLPIDEVKKISSKKLSDLKRRILSKASQPIEVIVCNRHGFVMDTIKEVIEEFGVDLIVLSSVGDSPTGAGYFGSIATDMINKLSVPLLVLPPVYRQRKIENAVVAIDLREPIDAATFGKSIYFLRDLDAVADIVYIAKTENEADSKEIKDATFNLRELLKNVPHTFKIEVAAKPTEAINNFVKKHKAQLLITFPKSHGFFESLFNKGNTRSLVFDVDVPVLAVQ
jgi:nucleotide-binding universal stress UspA family protein